MPVSVFIFCDKATGQPFKTRAVVGHGESHKTHRALYWIFHLHKLTAVGIMPVKERMIALDGILTTLHETIPRSANSFQLS